MVRPEEWILSDQRRRVLTMHVNIAALTIEVLDEIEVALD